MKKKLFFHERILLYIKVSCLTNFMNFYEEAERAGAVQLAEENTLGRPYSSLPVPEESLQQIWRWTF